MNSGLDWQWLTKTVVQNTSIETATLTLKYNDTSGAQAQVLAAGLPPMGSRVFPTPDGASGSLLIAATQSLAAVVNEVPYDFGWEGDGLMSYRGVGASGGDTEITLPPQRSPTAPVLSHAWQGRRPIRRHSRGKAQ